MTNKTYNVAIVGGGPGGIGAAIESAALNIDDVVLFEKGEAHSTTIRKFYKDNKRVDKEYKGVKVDLKGSIDFTDGTKESTLELFDTLISNHKIDIQFKTEIDSIKNDSGIFTLRTTNGDEVQSRFVVIAIGKMGTPNKPSYPIPLDIRKRVFFNANSINDGEKILIVGGGNSAVEYAYFLAEKNNVLLNYRRNEFSRINDVNRDLLQKSIDSGKLKTKLGIDIENLDSDNGNPKVNFTDGSSEIFDKIIYAIGGSAPIDFLQKCGIEVDASGIPKINNVYESCIKNMFVAGDLLFKSGGSIASALNDAFHISKEIRMRMS